jgi:hypothetical protein
MFETTSKKLIERLAWQLRRRRQALIMGLHTEFTDYKG